MNRGATTRRRWRHWLAAGVGAACLFARADQAPIPAVTVQATRDRKRREALQPRP